MSAIAAVVDLAGARVDEPAIRTMLGHMRQRGPDAAHVACLNDVALGHALLQTLPEDRPGCQPATDRRHAVTVVLDGRVDNRRELLALAEIPDEGQADAAVIAEAIVAAGEAALSRVLGDFALVAWNESQRSLMAARDLFGMRPLVYRRSGSRLLIASQVRAVVGDRLDPDEGMLAEVLSGRVTSLSATAFREVTRLSPGWMLVVRDGRISTTQFASVTRRDPDRRPLGDLQEECRALLDRAVRDRARSRSRVGIMLSGGIDSASVYATARRGAAPAAAAWTIEQRQESSETAQAATLVHHLSGEHHLAPATAGDFDYAAETAASWELPLDPSGANSAGLRLAAAASGTRVLLSGIGGDEFFSTQRWHCADRLARGQIRSLVRAWRRHLAAVEPPTLFSLAQATFAPFVPSWLRPLGAALIPGAGVPPWVAPELASRVGLPDRLRARGAFGGRTSAERATLLEVFGGASIWAHEDADRLAAMTGTEDRAPLFDRRIAEFTLSLPVDVLVAAPKSKGFLRDSFRHLLPPGLHRPVAALSFEHLDALALERLGGRGLFEDLLVEDAGWVNGAWVRRAVASTWPDGARAPVSPSPEVHALRQIAAVELWLRAVNSAGMASQRAG